MKKKSTAFIFMNFFERYLKDKDIIPDLKPKVVLKLFTDTLNKPSFTDIAYLESSFDKDAKLKTLVDYQSILNKYPWFKRLETKISRSSKLEYTAFIESLHLFIEAYATSLKRKEN